MGTERLSRSPKRPFLSRGHALCLRHGQAHLQQEAECIRHTPPLNHLAAVETKMVEQDIGDLSVGGGEAEQCSVMRGTTGELQIGKRVAQPGTHVRDGVESWGLAWVGMIVHHGRSHDLLQPCHGARSHRASCRVAAICCTAALRCTNARHCAPVGGVVVVSGPALPSPKNVA